MWIRKHQGFSDCKIELESIPTKQRPRYNPRTGKTYTPRATQKAEQAIRAAWLDKVGIKRAGHLDEVEVSVLITRPLAKSNPRRLIGSADLSRPDIDNVAKLVCDALNGLAYVDDKQITNLNVVKAPRIAYGSPASIYVRVDYYSGINVKDQKGA